MHKVVLEAKDEADLMDIDSRLSQGNIDHVLWREQPENIITAIATKPYVKSAYGMILRHLRLLKYYRLLKLTGKRKSKHIPIRMSSPMLHHTLPCLYSYPCIKAHIPNGKRAEVTRSALSSS